MAIAKTKKVHLVAHQRHQKNILEAVQQTGMVQIADNSSEISTNNQLNQQISSIEYQLAGISFAIQFLSQFEQQKKSFLKKIQASIEISPSTLAKINKTFDHQKIVEQVQEIESSINQQINIIEKLKEEQAQLSQWEDLPFIPKNRPTAKDFIYSLITISQTNLDDLEKSLSDNISLFNIETLSKHNEVVKVVVWHQNKDTSVIHKILDDKQATRYELPALAIPINDRLREIQKELQSAEEQIISLQKAGRQLSDDLSNLMIVHDYLVWEKEQLVQLQKANNTQKTMSLVFWVAEYNLDTIRKIIEKITAEFALDELEIQEGETIPVIFKNSWAKPFEAVTALYGAPQHDEPDPTPFLAPFFVLFFGLALTDAGYGLALSLAAYSAVKILGIPKENQKLFWVLFWGGIASFIIGILTGGWFAVDLNILPAPIKGLLQAVRLLDPIKNPMIIFYLSLALGVIQVLFGLAISVWWQIKNGKIIAALTGNGLWIATIVSLLMFAAAAAGLLPTSMTQPLKWLTIALVIGLVVAKTFQNKNPLVGFGLGVLGLYSFVGYFSDILSYSRLLALGLTTGIIGMVVNIMAGIVFPVPLIGWLLALIILIFGHAFNLGINALGAFVHSSRLQFIEFFPKFMEAGGEAFEPFARKKKYIKIINN